MSSRAGRGRGGGGGGDQKKAPAARPGKVSDRLNPKTVDPFNDKNTSAFAAVYRNGGVPCRLIHGSVKHKLAWDSPIETVPIDPVLVTLAEGLKETAHPYTFVARAGFKELLEVPGAGERAVPALSKLTVGIRAALIHKDPSVFEGGLEALVQLSNAVGPHLNPHLKQLLMSLGKKMLDRKYKELVTTALQEIEQNGGPDALPYIKTRVPTYTSVFM